MHIKEAWAAATGELQNEQSAAARVKEKEAAPQPVD